MKAMKNLVVVASFWANIWCDVSSILKAEVVIGLDDSFLILEVCW
jgi:hypothetical protein